MAPTQGLFRQSCSLEYRAASSNAASASQAARRVHICTSSATLFYAMAIHVCTFPATLFYAKRTVLYSVPYFKTLFCSAWARPSYALAPALNGTRTACRPPRAWKLQVFHACVRGAWQPSASVHWTSEPAAWVCAKFCYPSVPVSVMCGSKSMSMQHQHICCVTYCMGV